MENTQQLKNHVEYCLKHFIHTRNDDDFLWVNVCQRFYSLNSIMPIMNTGDLTTMLKTLPKISTVSRVRRAFQSSGKYLPTNEKVAQGRRLNMEVWRREMNKLRDDLNKCWPVEVNEIDHTGRSVEWEFCKTHDRPYEECKRGKA